jgi:hypothetical protein
MNPEPASAGGTSNLCRRSAARGKYNTLAPALKGGAFTFCPPRRAELQLAQTKPKAAMHILENNDTLHRWTCRTLTESFVTTEV